LARWGSGRTNQFKYGVLCRLQQVGDPDTVSQNAKGAFWVSLDHVVIDAVKQGDNWVVCEGAFDLIGVPLVEAKLTISVCVMWMVATALIFLVFHKVEVPVETVEGIPEEQSY